MEVHSSLLHESSSTDARKLIKDRRESLFSIAGVLPVEDPEVVASTTLTEHAGRIMQQMKLSREHISALEQATREQSPCALWHAEHVGRITTSKAHRALTGATSKTPDALVREIFLYKYAQRGTTCAPLLHGLRLEPTARVAYIRHMDKAGEKVAVEERGLVVSEEYPFLTTSTNGFIENSNGERGVLEK